MKIGELFVDLDFRDGGALNKLTNFSIKFLALKTAASQLGDVFDNMFGSVIDGVVEMENLNQVTGLNIEKMQKWKAVAEQNNVAFGDIISSLKNLQSASADIMLGKGNAAPFTQLGIDMTRPREAFALLDEIRARIGEIKDPGLRRNLLQEMGVSENMLILFNRFNGYFDRNLQLTKEERKAVMDLNKEWIALKQTAGFAWDKVWARAASGASSYVKELRGVISYYAQVIKDSDSLGEALEKVFTDLSATLDKLGRDNKLLSVMSGFVKAVESLSWFFGKLGEGLGYGAAYAQEGISQVADWAQGNNEYNENIMAQRRAIAQRYGANSQELAEFVRNNPLRRGEQVSPLWNANINDLNPNNPLYRAFQEKNASQVDNSSRTQNINTNVTINTSQPADEEMGRKLGDSFNNQVGNAGYINN